MYPFFGWFNGTKRKQAILGCPVEKGHTNVARGKGSLSAKSFTFPGGHDHPHHRLQRWDPSCRVRFFGRRGSPDAICDLQSARDTFGRSLFQDKPRGSVDLGLVLRLSIPLKKH